MAPPPLGTCNRRGGMNANYKLWHKNKDRLPAHKSNIPRSVPTGLLEAPQVAHGEVREAEVQHFRRQFAQHAGRLHRRIHARLIVVVVIVVSVVIGVAVVACAIANGPTRPFAAIIPASGRRGGLCVMGGASVEPPSNKYPQHCTHTTTALARTPQRDRRETSFRGQ